MNVTEQSLRNDQNLNHKRSLPPIRSLKKEMLENRENDPSSNKNSNRKNRIGSFEYQKWDKYDADAEALKIDLDEERKIEFSQIQKTKKENASLIEEIYEDDVSTLTKMEKEVLAKRYKEKGNDYFRAKEYDYAIVEYSTSLKIFPLAATFNNRAIAC